jgi:hypothetical protein
MVEYEVVQLHTQTAPLMALKDRKPLIVAYVDWDFEDFTA